MSSFVRLPRFPATIHQCCCVVLFLFVSWGLLTPDPYSAVQHAGLGRPHGVSDTVLHFVVYGSLSVTCWMLIGARAHRRRRAVIAMLLMTHAIGTECLQSFIPGRTCDPRDVVANFAGILCGVLIANLIRTGYRRLSFGVEHAT